MTDMTEVEETLVELVHLLDQLIQSTVVATQFIERALAEEEPRQAVPDPAQP